MAKYPVKIDGDDVFGALSKQLGEGSLARTEVGDDVVVEDLEKTLREGFPGTAGHIVAPEFAGQFVKVGARSVLPFAQNMAEGSEVLLALGELCARLACDLEEIVGHPGGVDIVLPGALVDDEPFLLKLSELRRYPGLAHAEDFLQFRHAEILLREQEEQPEPGAVGEQFQGIEN